MPGAGKTTAAESLRQHGYPVLGEYLDDHGATLDLAAHPDVADDNSHQTNWLTKHTNLTELADRPVFLDRDWLSALAYAYSLPEPAATELLTARAHWTTQHLYHGHLAVADTYVVFDLPVTDSLHRRTNRLTAGHPWSNPAGLARLRRFYQDPPAAVRTIHPDLATHLRTTDWRHITGLSPARTVELLRDLAGQP